MCNNYLLRVVDLCSCLIIKKNKSLTHWLYMIVLQYPSFIPMLSHCPSFISLSKQYLVSFLTLTCAPASGMALFLKNVAFHGILLDALFDEGNREWEEVSSLLKRGIVEGVVQPLRTTVFERNQVEDAFRYMAQGKHIGKVLLQVSTTSA